MKTLNIYVTKAFLATFLTAIGILTFGMTGARLMKVFEYISSGVPASNAFTFLLYVLPIVLAFTIPWAALVSVMLVFGRLSAISAMRAGGGAVITTAEALMQFTASPSYFKETSVTLETGSTADVESLSELLLKGGYKRVGRVDGKGLFARRGDVFDIWSPQSDAPVRVEFFDDEIEKISTFDPFSQLKKSVLSSFSVIPASEFEYGEKTRKTIINALKNQKNKGQLG